MDRENMAVDLFKNMANVISEEYVLEIAAMKLLNGTKPGFDELKEILIHLDKGLTEKGAWFLGVIRKKSGFDEEMLTEEFKKVIADTIGQFIKKL